MKKFLSIIMLISLLTNNVSAINLDDVSNKFNDFSAEIVLNSKEFASKISSKAEALISNYDQKSNSEYVKNLLSTANTKVALCFTSIADKVKADFPELVDNITTFGKNMNENYIPAASVKLEGIVNNGLSFVSEHKIGFAVAASSIVSSYITYKLYKSYRTYCYDYNNRFIKYSHSCVLKDGYIVNR